MDTKLQMQSIISRRCTYFLYASEDDQFEMAHLALFHHVLEGDGKVGKKTKGDPAMSIMSRGRYFPAITDYQIATRHLIRGAVSYMSR